MNQLIHSPSLFSLPKHKVTLVPVEPDGVVKLMSELSEQQAMQREGQWYRAGTGPSPATGGIWISGTPLTPLDTVSGTISRIDYSYTPEKWGNWISQISMRMLIVAGSSAWTADVTTSTNSSIDATGAGIPAQCELYLQMKVGDITGGLFDPPSVSVYDAWVYYS